MVNVILNGAKRSEESLYRPETARFFAALRMTRRPFNKALKTLSTGLFVSIKGHCPLFNQYQLACQSQVSAKSA